MAAAGHGAGAWRSCCAGYAFAGGFAYSNGIRHGLIGQTAWDASLIHEAIIDTMLNSVHSLHAHSVHSLDDSSGLRKSVHDKAPARLESHRDFGCRAVPESHVGGSPTASLSAAARPAPQRETGVS